ncbi:MAG: hypothetical protein KBS72_05120 [Bacteroidales bacterium]|nr:hypothetical protein [Candidatus Cacconaster scatequi]
MNLIVLRSDGSWYTRPDSTLCRVSEDFYLPEGFTGIEIHKCRFVKLLKAGKSILPRFAGRYFAPLCEGYLYYGISDGGNSVPYIDRTTILLEDIPVCQPDAEEISRICGVSSIMTFRRGDLVILEDPESTILKQGDTFGQIDIR